MRKILTKSEEEVIELYKDARMVEKIPQNKVTDIYIYIGKRKGITRQAAAKPFKRDIVKAEVEKFESNYAQKESFEKKANASSLDEELVRNLEFYNVISLEYMLKPLYDMYEEAKKISNLEEREARLMSLNRQIISIKKDMKDEEKDYISSASRLTMNDLVSEFMVVLRTLLGNDRLKSVLLEVLGEQYEEFKYTAPTRHEGIPTR